MKPDITTETRSVDVNGEEMYVSILTFNRVIVYDDPEVVAQTIAQAYQSLADEFMQQPNIDKQKSVCMIMDVMPVIHELSQDVLEDWFKNASEESTQTQRFLYQLFKRPSFSISTLTGIDADFIRKGNESINASANQIHLADGLPDAINKARKLLAMAHR